MRPLLVLGTAALTWLIACGSSDDERETYPAVTVGGAGASSLTDAGAGAAGTREPAFGTDAAGECSGRRVEVREIADGTVSAGTDVELEGVIATSQKFLVVRSSTGSCLWGVFVSAGVAQAAEHTGVMVVAYGVPSQARANGELEPCRPGSDAIPDDVAIGDLLSIRGKTEVYAPSWCTNRAVAGQTRVRALRACPISKLGSGTPPEPLAIDIQTANQLARGADGALLQAWASVFVRMTGVSGKQDGTSPDIVGAYGTIRLDETLLEVRDKIYFAGLAPGGIMKSPEFGYPTTFSRIDGLVFLEYCDWVLAPRDKCRDFDPPSADCTDPLAPE